MWRLFKGREELPLIICPLCGNSCSVAPVSCPNCSWPLEPVEQNGKSLTSTRPNVKDQKSTGSEAVRKAAEGASRTGADVQQASDEETFDLGEKFSHFWTHLPSHERRVDERVPVSLAVSFEETSSKAEGRVSNISISGCRIENAEQVWVGGIYHLRIHMPTGRLLPLLGEVIYSDSGMSCGVRFVNLSEGERTLITLLIDYARGN